MKKHFFLILTIAATVLFGGCADSDAEEPQDSLNKETALDVDNTKPIGDNNRVIYEMNLYNFTSAGTLNAAKDKLGELRTLGIDIVWLMPIQPRSTKNKIGSLGSPYAISDYTDVNIDHCAAKENKQKAERMTEFKAFVKKAHELGMEVWLDWVPNHTGSDHIWLTEHPEFYKWNGSEVVHPQAGGITYNDVAQLDYSNSSMRTAMQEAMKYWVVEGGIDGFRCDFVSSEALPADFWSATIPKLQQAAGRKIWMLGESDFQPEKPALLSVGFDYDYTVGYHWHLKNDIGKTDLTSKLKTQCRSLINNSAYANMDRMVYLTNHDDTENGQNYFSYFSTNVAPLTVLEFTLYGMPLLYNGQEIGYRKVQDYFNKDVIDRSTPDKRLKNTIRTLVALRHTQPALGSGKKSERPTTTFLECSSSSYLAYTKKKDNNTVLVVLSLSKDTTECTIKGIEEGVYTQWLNSETIVDRIVKKDVELKAEMTFTLPKKGYAVYVKK